MIETRLDTPWKAHFELFSIVNTRIISNVFEMVKNRSTLCLVNWKLRFNGENRLCPSPGVYQADIRCFCVLVGPYREATRCTLLDFRALWHAKIPIFTIFSRFFVISLNKLEVGTCFGRSMTPKITLKWCKHNAWRFLGPTISICTGLTLGNWIWPPLSTNAPLCNILGVKFVLCSG